MVPLFIAVFTERLESTSVERIADHDKVMFYFIKSLVFSFWLGIISLYSFELGYWCLGLVVVPLLWCCSRELCDLISVPYGCQHGALWL
ncbi:hypothetical protein RchiOBHm_Chr5g0070111 [Rosa chinensis]|uniref:Uncharacterized protein n=1 Tax=Rosa chinensis TaxID=74649 RepID=A0A2P6QK34_ROSCH|nr:hypothetical protein RchiOBHm_Chr5g0070111 [Rosa chinensis]